MFKQNCGVSPKRLNLTETLIVIVIVIVADKGRFICPVTDQSFFYGDHLVSLKSLV